MNSKVLTGAALCLLLATVALTIMYFIYVPLGTDGGWYAYPSYAWAQGGDPSENMPGAAAPTGEPRVVARFDWENRSNLTVPMTALWLKMAEPTWQALRELGLLQYLAIVALAVATIWSMTRDRVLTAAGGLLIASESGVIAGAISDARPDVTVTLASIALLLALLTALRRNSAALKGVALVLATILPLLHATAAISVAYLVGFIVLLLFWYPREEFGEKKTAFLVTTAVVLLGVFLLRQQILDVLVPTAVPHEIELPYRHSLVHKLQTIIRAGFAVKFDLELQRWKDSFFLGNVAQLAFLGFGVYAAVRWTLARRPGLRLNLAGSMFVAFCGAVVAMFIVDPHPTQGHTTPLIALGLVAASMAVHSFLQQQQSPEWSRRVIVICAGLLAAAAVLKLGHTWKIYDRFVQQGISNSRFEAALAAAIPAAGAITIVGPTEIWPYMATRRQWIRIIDDDRATMLKSLHVATPSESFLIINEDYFGYGWGEAADSWEKQGVISKQVAVGSCGLTPACLIVYKIRTPQLASPSGAPAP